MIDLGIKIAVMVGAAIMIWASIKRRNIEKQLKGMDDNDTVPEHMVEELHRFINLYVLGVLITSVAGLIRVFLR